MAVKLLSEIWRDRPTIYWMYFLVGGIYTSEEFPKRIKWLYFAIHFGILFLSSMWLIGYLITIKLSISLQSIIALTLPFVGINLLTFCPLLLHYFRHDTIQILDFIRVMRKEVFVEDPFKLSSIKRINVFKYCINFSKIFYGAQLLYCIIPLVDILLNYKKSSDFSDLRYHLMAAPYIDSIDTLGSHCAAYFLEALLLSIFMMFGLANLSLFSAIVSEVNNIVVDFCGRIQSTSLKYGSEFGLFCNCPRLLALFDQDVILLIKEHQLICR